MNGFIIATSKKYDKVLYTPHNWLSPSLNNCHLHEISLFFVLPTNVKIILMRLLHDPIVTKLCQNPWNRLYTWKSLSKACSHSATFLCEIKDTDDVLPIKDGTQCPSWQLFLWILLISYCPRMEILEWKVAFSEYLFRRMCFEVVIFGASCRFPTNKIWHQIFKNMCNKVCSVGEGEES